MKLIDPEHPFFQKAWKRWTVVIAPLGWAAVEFVSGQPVWGMLFGALGLYALWVLVIRFPPPGAPPPGPPPPPPGAE